VDVRPGATDRGNDLCSAYTVAAGEYLVLSLGRNFKT
jgi:hypothetical protein